MVAGLLILFKRTRIAGFFLASGRFNKYFYNKYQVRYFGKTIHLIPVNGGVLQFLSFLKNYHAFFIQHVFPALKRSPLINGCIHVLCTGIAGFILFPYVSSGTMNDDKAERPFLHGAYQIEHFTMNDDSLNSCDFPYRRFFYSPEQLYYFSKGR